MADIFLSYSSADRPAAKGLAEALEKLGFDVWWDREIPLGRPYNEVIAEEVQKARCVLVLWSPRSKQSHWVYEEAVKGRDRGVLIPALIERTDLPMGFSLLQAADLTDWEQEENHPGYRKLVDDIRALLGRPPAERPSSTAATGRAPSKALRKALWLAVPAALVGLVALVLLYWHVPTRVRLDLTVDRLVFTVGGKGRTPLLQPVDFTSLTVRRFETLEFEPASLSIADPTRYDEQTGATPVDAWQSVKTTGSLTLRARADGAPSSVRADAPAAGRLAAVSLVPGATVTLETAAGPPPRLTAAIDGQRTELTLTPNGRLALTANHLAVAPPSRLPFDAETLELRTELPARNPNVVIRGEPEALALVVRPADGELQLLSTAGTPVSAIDFVRPRPDAQDRGFEPSLVAEGRLEYPDAEGIASIRIGSDEFVGLKDLDQCTIQSLAAQPDLSALKVRLDCKAKSIRTRSGEFVTERALTAMQRLWHSSKLAVLVTLVGAALSMTMSAYQFVRSLNRPG